MRNPQGYATLNDPDARLQEWDTFTCKHCNCIVTVKPRMDPADLGGLCKQCMGLICPSCVTRGTCDPWEKQMARMEARDHFLRSAGIG